MLAASVDLDQTTRMRIEVSVYISLTCHKVILTLKALIATTTDDTLKYILFVLSKKHRLTFYVNYLPGRQFIWTVKGYFL